jgi:cell division septation protein DedD
LTSVEPTGAEEGENIPAEFEPHHAEAVTLAAPQVSASAEPRPSAKPDIEKAAPPTKEGPIIAIGGRALNNKVLQRKPPVWGR